MNPEIAAEIEKNAAAERAEIAAVLKMTAEEIAAVTAEYWQIVNGNAAEFAKLTTDAEKSEFVDTHIAQIAAIGVKKIAVDFVEWAHKSDTEFPGLGDALIAGFLSSTGIGSVTYKRDNCRPIVWKFQNDAKKAERAAAAKVAEEKLEKRIADLNARGLKICDRCGGAGGWKGWPGYTCYKCRGNGSVPMTDREKKAYKRTIAAIAAK